MGFDPDSADSKHFPISLGRVQGFTFCIVVVPASVEVVLFSVVSGFSVLLVTSVLPEIY